MATVNDGFGEQLDSLYTISVEIAALRDLPQIYDRALSHCLALTDSQMGFIGLLNEGGVDMEVVAIKGFQPSDPSFYERFKTIPVRPSVFGVTIIEQRPHVSNDVQHDPLRVGPPPGHPILHTFLGVPLRVGSSVIGMIGVANKPRGYDAADERLLSTFANQVAVAIDNAGLYDRQREMIIRLQHLNLRLSEAERDQLLAVERARIAAGLHDHIEQDIFSIGLQLGSIVEAEVDHEVAERLRDLRELAVRTADEVREVIFALAAPDQSADLSTSVRRILRDIQRRHGLDTDLVVSGSPVSASATVQQVIVGVIKEALTNVVKHAHARFVLVSVRYETDRVDVVVQDDGVGAAALVVGREERSDRHFGVRNMRQQIEDLGGTFEVLHGDEGGLTVRFSTPIPVAAVTR